MKEFIRKSEESSGETSFSSRGSNPSILQTETSDQPEASDGKETPLDTEPEIKKSTGVTSDHVKDIDKGKSLAERTSANKRTVDQSSGQGHFDPHTTFGKFMRLGDLMRNLRKDKSTPKEENNGETEGEKEIISETSVEKDEIKNAPGVPAKYEKLLDESVGDREAYPVKDKNDEAKLTEEAGDNVSDNAVNKTSSDNSLLPADSGFVHTKPVPLAPGMPLKEDEKLQEKEDENRSLKEPEVLKAGAVNPIETTNLIPAEDIQAKEEVSPEEQEHLQKEFEIYSLHKMEMIEKGDSLDPFESKKTQTKEEKIQKFRKKTTRFLNRMEGHKKRFWGTEKYKRLLNKWFPDYDFVINHKVKLIKNTINDELLLNNQIINDVIITTKEAVLVADMDVTKTIQLLEVSEKHLVKANEQKEKAGNILAEYGKEYSRQYMERYDEVISSYKSLIGALHVNINGITEDKAGFIVITDELSAQQSLLNAFNTKITETSDVQLLIHLQETEFSALIAQSDKTVIKALNTGRKTEAVDEVATQKVLDSGEKKITVMGTEVEGIKQAEIKRREEERKRKEEEERKKAEAEQRRLEEERNKSKSPALSNANKGKNELRSRGGTDYTKTLWSPSDAIRDSKMEIDESKISDKAFFEQYKKTSEAYLKEWYKQINATKKLLTSDMFVNAAKRIYLKYGDLSYIVPVELAMIQGRLESGLGTKGSNPYKNPYNVGETDKGAKPWVKDMTTPEEGIFFYMDLMAHDYLSAKTADQLLEKQGETFENEQGSRYASAPRYEMELKAMMGQVGLVRDKKRPMASVGKGKGKSNTSASANFVQGMLTKLGYKQANLGDAITEFQKKEMYPPLTNYQKELVREMNDGDLESFNSKEKTGVDGVVDPRGNTVGLLYYMTYMENLFNTPSVKNVKEKETTPSTSGGGILEMSIKNALSGVADAPIHEANKKSDESTDTNPYIIWKNKIVNDKLSAKEKNKQYAELILEAKKLGIVTFSSEGSKHTVSGLGGTEDTFVKIKEGKEIGTGKKSGIEKNHKFDSAQKEIDILVVIVSILREEIKKWDENGRTGKVTNLVIGSFMIWNSYKKNNVNLTGELRTSQHGKGQAIDFNIVSGSFASDTALESVVRTLNQLPKLNNVVYGIGLPLQGEFFDSTKRSLLSHGSTKVNGKFNQAEKYLKSQKIKDTLTKLRSNGYEIIVFPDNDNHLHIQIVDK
ncbi:hypothetical protein [Fluviicola sp.]|uniref:hypothetical protein n=1 Tax=Fluviicola sp. TaxID=1917219 RepID=UPI0031D09A35